MHNVDEYFGDVNMIPSLTQPTVVVDWCEC